eukprot:COSAG01_NODE_15434_length_1338_cov_0.856336_1_plen_83_part_00
MRSWLHAPVTWQLLERYFQAVFDKHWRLPTRSDSDDDGIADNGVAILHELLSTERLVPSMSTTLSASGGGSGGSHAQRPVRA